MEQRTPEWIAARAGKVTASRVADVVAKTKSGYSTSRANYMAELLCERLTGKASDFFQSAAMQWGTETEPMACTAYESRSGNLVTATGLVVHPQIEMAGASPDGLIDDDGLIEIKCPMTATHIDTLLGGSVPGKYVIQIHWQMACTGRKWCDFVSFDPRMPAEMQLSILRVERDERMIQDLEREVKLFLTELDDKMKALTSAYGKGTE